MVAFADAARQGAPIMSRTRSTREALLDAAERLFAERGLYAVSLSEIGRAAHQQNRSVIQYHFGSRERLIEAVATRHLASANAHRAELLHTLDITGRAHDLRALVETLILPPFHQTETLRSHYFRFLLRWSFGVQSSDVFTALLQSADTSAFAETVSRIDGLLADVDAEVRQFRYRNAFMGVIRALAEREAALERPGELDERFVVTALTDMVTGLLGAPDHTKVGSHSGD
jgi:AcrR family transcriptional regulator